jgi:phenylalanyl-tRNA synthetase alpha chain
MNIPLSINNKRNEKLHNKKYNPICMIKERIYSYFDKVGEYKKFDDLSEVVSIEENFDSLLIPSNHPSRSKSDTYYIDEKTVLRTHTSAHQNELLKEKSVFWSQEIWNV